ncbi:cAMP-dependent protein kinase catalytic subunit PRKX isoform X1 [Sminthopsis crassicaudata]|uniref:Protein kinase cAMP-dependent X-linked catalytic subunit n=2 Tax=Metatheria TaxID=9263 RepID=A0A7N4PI26_SARHA|nr:cAMP-dependent protein kinase catalytic subunit PRKX isoform X2 [Sarcophilus harrisii]
MEAAGSSAKAAKVGAGNGGSEGSPPPPPPLPSPPPPPATPGSAGSGDSEPAHSSSPAAGPGSPAPSPELPAYKLQDFDTLATVGTGTFGRVHLVKERTAKHYFALKVMSIPDVIRLKQEQHVHNEKSVLKEVNHPFLIRLYWTYHDERFLYMLMEYVPGGELFSYLRNMGRFNNSTGLFYSAEIICAIEYLHSKEIVYRDLKPENILLDKEGHIKLTDFGFAKKLVDRTWTLCGTPEYLAPEVIQSKGHGRAVDWWALGILIFEMLSGFPPFFDDNPFGIYQKILAGKIDFPRHLDLYVKDLIKKLLVVDRTRRLGNMKEDIDKLECVQKKMTRMVKGTGNHAIQGSVERKNGADDVKRHRWFRSVDWDAVPQRKLKPPIVPKVSNDGDTSNFEAYPEDDWNKTPPVPPKDLEIFKNF